jgi:hypothetical protein
MKESTLPDRVTMNWLADCSGMHFNTVKKRVEGMQRDQDGKLDRVKALGRLYIGEGGELSYSEVMKGLAVAKTMQVQLQNEATRKERVPLQDFQWVFDEVTQAIANIVKSSGLPRDSANEIFAKLQDIPNRLGWPPASPDRVESH